MNSRVAKQTRTAKRGARVAARAFDDGNVVISSANAICLALGRFVFLPYQRAQVERVGAPTQNGQTHFAAGDSRAEEASFIVSTNDPAGFTIVDLLAWGSIGHAVGFLALASQSAQTML
jgi:photosystem I subunit V